MTKTNILVIGGGGREDALITTLKKSPDAGEIYILPGNGGINRKAIPLDISVNDHKAIIEFCVEGTDSLTLTLFQRERGRERLTERVTPYIGLVVVGPEDPLVNGIVDDLEEAGITVFGASKAAAKIEGSKEHMKDICKRYRIPSAEYETFTDSESAKAYVEEKGAPIVIKTDGLAAGKGVTVAASKEEAISAIDDCFNGKFGAAGKKIVIEEFLVGEEASFFAISDGKTVIPFSSAQDHKAVGEGDTGANTGGMGTYSPAPVVTESLHESIMNDIIQPLVEGMAKDGTPYKGVIFAGLMINNGEVKLLEFNIRFGDPECQVLLPRLKSDLLTILLAASNGTLNTVEPEFSDKTTLCVVMAAKGYPAGYQKGTVISNLEEAEKMEDITVFHAGTKQAGDKLVANGGRVLGITAIADDIISAQEKAYKAVDAIDWKDGFCRRDIGWRAVKRVG